MSRELSEGTVIQDIKGKEYKIISKISEGAQGRIYELENHMIAKINYDKGNSREKNLKQLYWIMKQNIPLEARIAKPLEILDEPYTGYIMKRVPKDYEPLSKYININSKYTFSEWYNDITGGLKKRLQIGIMMAKSIRSLHFEGLTYCDVSPNNILVSPTKNSIAIIDADNLMATEVFSAEVLGTPGYIAPEICLEARQPNSLSDVYSFAVLIFEMLCLGHPLVGDSILEENHEVEDEAKMGKSVYVNHKNDDTNRNKLVTKLMIFLTEELKSLFEQTFTIGLNNPSSRPSLLEFIEVMEMALDQVVNCKNPNCSGTFLYDPKNSVKCPFCKNEEEGIDHLSFYRKISAKSFELYDYLNIGEIKNMESIIENSCSIVLNNTITYLRKRHFDRSFDTKGNDKVLKVIRIGPKNYRVVLIDKSLPIYIKGREKRAILMEYGLEYNFIHNDTAVLFKPNSNLFDGSPIETDTYSAIYNITDENDIAVIEYVAIYY